MPPTRTKVMINSMSLVSELSRLSPRWHGIPLVSYFSNKYPTFGPIEHISQKNGGILLALAVNSRIKKQESDVCQIPT